MSLGRKVCFALTIAFLPVLFAGGTRPVSAQTDPGSVGLEPGTCGPGLTTTETLVTCRFRITTPGLIGDGIVYAKLADSFAGNSAPCAIEEDVLVCPDLLTPALAGDYRVDIPALGLTAMARVSTVAPTEPVWLLVREVNRLDTVPVGSEITIEALSADGRRLDQPLDAVLIRPDTTSVKASSRTMDPGEENGEVKLALPASGRWLLMGCALPLDVDQVTDIGQCEATSTPLALNGLDIDAEPLLGDHNNDNGDRIDLVFIGTGMGDSDHLAAASRALLSLDGKPMTLNERGVSVVHEGGLAEQLGWGLFSIDPLSESIDRFNFWYVRQANLGSPMNPGARDIDLRFDVTGLGPHAVIINLSQWGVIDGQQAKADLPSFALSAGDELPDRSDIRFGRVYLPITGDPLPGEATILSHELGHALFGLRDEYDEAGSRTATVGPPNCAASMADAVRYWGHLVGDLDPMYQRWRDVSTEAGEWYNGPETAPEAFTVDYIEGGCFVADGGQALRPTADSLMNHGAPVLGAVNRERVEQVLALWPGHQTPDEGEQPTASVQAPNAEATPTSPASDPSSADDDRPGIGESAGGLSTAMVGVLSTLGVVGLAMISFRSVAQRRERRQQPSRCR